MRLFNDSNRNILCITAALTIQEHMILCFPRAKCNAVTEKTLQPQRFLRQNNDTAVDTIVSTAVSVLVEARGVEPLSENASPGTSPGADGYSGSLALPVPLPQGKPSRLGVG